MGFAAGVPAAGSATAWSAVHAALGTVLDGVPWPILAITGAWFVVALAFLAVVRAAGEADEAADRQHSRLADSARRPMPPPATATAPAAEVSIQPARRFARHRPGDPVAALGSPDVDRLVETTGQVLGAHRCVLRPGALGTDDREVGWPAVASTPVLVRGTVFGHLVVASEDQRDFTGADLELLGAMAELVAATLATAAPDAGAPDVVRAQLEALESTLAARERGHRGRSVMCRALAPHVAERLLEEDPRAQAEVLLAARLHDVGMLRVPHARLRRPAPLAPVEAGLVERHPAWGSEIVAGVPRLAGVAVAVRFHQERWDGRGYPHGIAGERIPLTARIVGACAAWAAIVAGSPHAPARTPEHAVAEIRRHAGTQFDPAVAAAIAVASPLVTATRAAV